VIDHIGLHVRDIARATEFYLETLAPLGIAIVMQVSAEETGHGAAVGFGANQKPFFWLGEGGDPSGPMHIAFAAPNRAAVDTFYEAASRLAPPITASPGSGPSTTPTITVPSSSTPTATMSRPCAICLNEPRASAA
jgi:catechol 2,3-dioxygenase-like lactoylglutathione lyase family enzyme